MNKFRQSRLGSRFGNLTSLFDLFLILVFVFWSHTLLGIESQKERDRALAADLAHARSQASTLEQQLSHSQKTARMLGEALEQRDLLIQKLQAPKTAEEVQQLRLLAERFQKVELRISPQGELVLSEGALSPPVDPDDRSLAREQVKAFLGENLAKFNLDRTIIWIEPDERSPYGVMIAVRQYLRQEGYLYLSRGVFVAPEGTER